MNDLDPIAISAMPLSVYASRFHDAEWVFTAADIDAMRIRKPGRPSAQQGA